MSRKDDLDLNKGVLCGNNVSHSNRKTRRRFLPNLQNFSLASDALGTFVKLRVTPKTIKSVDKAGGLDQYLLSKPATRLSKEVQLLRKRISNALNNRQETKSEQEST